MQAATPATVAAWEGFDNRTVRDGEEEFRFYRAGRRFMVETRHAGTEPRQHVVRYTFGVSPLQQYLVAADGGRLQALTLAWDVEGRRWFSLHDGPPPSPGDTLHWSGRYQNWNAMCAECHSTALDKGYREKTDTYRTTWASIEVGCQACHGPGATHVAAARRGAHRPPPASLRGIDAATAVDQCARCHARRVNIATGEPSSASLLDHYLPETLRQRIFHADGQQLGEVFEYASYRQSRMYQAGVRCTDCHESHASKPRLAGNALCVQCHSASGAGRFTGLRLKSYDDPAHHFHASGTPGAQCVNCHMPASNYMKIHSRRDHSIRVPRPDLAARTGSPDACTHCHTGRTPTWAAAELERRFGPPAGGTHYGEHFARLRRGERRAVLALRELSGDQAAPALVRASAVEAIGREGIAPPLSALHDSDPIVRSSAAEQTVGLPPARRIAALLPLLDDPVRAVRIAAARSLADLPDTTLMPTARARREAVLREYRAAQQIMTDLPAAHLNLAGLHGAQGQVAAAENELRAALRLDPRLPVARVELARLQAAKGDLAAAERSLTEGLAQGADAPELLYSLALLRAERGDVENAIATLRAARARGANQPRLRLNLAMLLRRSGQDEAAVAEIESALAHNPEDVEARRLLIELRAH